MRDTRNRDLTPHCCSDEMIRQAILITNTQVEWPRQLCAGLWTRLGVVRSLL